MVLVHRLKDISLAALEVSLSGSVWNGLVVSVLKVRRLLKNQEHGKQVQII
jgi:hypothetical protein